ncbi:hypothetical protein ScPMuIL_003373, partial [Solemya velum]
FHHLFYADIYWKRNIRSKVRTVRNRDRNHLGRNVCCKSFEQTNKQINEAAIFDAARTKVRLLRRLSVNSKMPESYEFKDMNKMTSQNSLADRNPRESGCYLSTAKGFILLLLAILIAVLIGVIVHFAGSKSFECKYTFPADFTGVGNDALIQECENLAAEGNQQICNACPETTGTTHPIISHTTPAPEVKVDVRLPTALVPLAYEVKLRPNLYGPDPEKFSFTGSVRIEVECKSSTNNVTLHMKELDIAEESITIAGGGETFVARYETDTKRQFVILKLDHNMTAGVQYHISMDFVGPLKGGLNGLYLSSYKRGNETVYMAATQFQATDARKAFPCFDEPAIKATFRITLERKPIKIAVSNMPIETTEDVGDGWVADHFQTSPKMPTYLLAFIVCDFEYTESTTTRNVKYRAWARPEAIAQTQYGLQIGVDVLTFFEDYFNITYPLPKQDMIALPDFSAGAMENWGLITYRETAMLYDPGESSEGDRQRVAVVITHELAHQASTVWFGDLVTPSWWDDIWLNEGFATYMEYFGTVQVEPDWKMFEQFVNREIHSSFDFDGLISSHPLFVPVADPAEINEVFDSISYAKGASVIRMAKFFMQDDTFQKGLTNYLRSLEYGAATHDDLWYAWGNQSVVDGRDRTDVKEIMDTWILQMNYPVVNVKRTQNGMSLSQKRFLLDATSPDPGKYTSPFGYKWDIPFTYTHEDEQDFTASRINWMNRGDLVLVDSSLSAPSANKWVLANIQQYGYYRVNYEENNWRQLIRQLVEDHTVIPVINRAQILNDAWNLARAGLLDMKIALETTNYLKNEREYIPFDAALDGLGFIDTMLQRHELFGAFGRFMSGTVTEYFTELTMNNTGATHMESFRRSQIASTACGYDVESCIRQAKVLYAQWMTNPSVNPVNPGLRYTVYCTAIRTGGLEEWDFAYEQHRTSNLASEQYRLRSAMACSEKVWILSRYLKRSLMPDEIRLQDAIGVIVGIANNPVGRALVWDFIRAHWKKIREEFIALPFAMSALFRGIAGALNTPWDLQQLEEFQNKEPDMGSGTRAYNQAIEETKSNIKWMEKNIPVIESWLDDNGFL